MNHPVIVGGGRDRANATGLSRSDHQQPGYLQIDHLTKKKIGQVSNREILQMPDASGGLLLYDEGSTEPDRIGQKLIIRKEVV